MSKMEGKMKIVMDGPGTGRVFIDGIELRGIVGLSMDIVPGSENRVRIELQPSVLEFFGHSECVVECLALRKELAGSLNPYRRKALGMILDFVQVRLGDQRYQANRLFEEARKEVVKELWTRRKVTRRARDLDQSLPKNSTDHKAKRRF